MQGKSVIMPASVQEGSGPVAAKIMRLGVRKLPGALILDSDVGKELHIYWKD